MNRNIFSRYSLIFVLLLISIITATSFADESDMNKKVLAPSFVLFEADDPENYIYSKKPDLKIMPASTTKIMTCILALENCADLNEIVSVPDNATTLKSTNTLMGLRRGESLPLIDLLYGMMLPSGNDAAITVATHVAGSVEAFAEMMNAKAQELGMENTHFTNASGVYNSQHYSTCRDMGRLASYAMKNEMFRKIVSTAEYDVPGNEYRKTSLHLLNTNRLVSDPVTSDYFYEYAIGCKTGSTEKGGKCLVAAAEKDGVTLIALLLGVKDGGDKSTRIRRCFTDAKMMFQTAFDNMYVPVSPADIGINGFTTEVSIDNATKRNNETGLLTCKATFSADTVSVRKEKLEGIQSDPAQIDTNVLWKNDKFSAPIEAGQRLGTVTFSFHGRKLFESELLAERSIDEYDPIEDITPSPALTAAPTPSPMPVITDAPFTATQGELSPTVFYAYISFIVMFTAISAIIIIRSAKRSTVRVKTK